MNVEQVQNALCKSLCADVVLHPEGQDRVLVETPFVLPDGDSYSIHLVQRGMGLRITDLGDTFMRLSYREDLKRFEEGTRAKLLESIVRQGGVQFSEGELWMDSPFERVGENIFRFAQVMTRIHDLEFLRRARVEKTFYEDLAQELRSIVKGREVLADYLVPELGGESEIYPVDFYVKGKEAPLYIFGVPDSAKAKLVTITLQHFLIKQLKYNSVVVFDDQEKLNRRELARLTNAAGEMVSSLAAHDALERKVKHYAEA